MTDITELAQRLATCAKEDTYPVLSPADCGALVEALEKAQTGEKQWREVADAFCDDDADWHKLTNLTNELISLLSQALCKQADRIAELESRTVTVKLPEPPGPMSIGARTVYFGIVADVVRSFQDGLSAAGIKVEAE